MYVRVNALRFDITKVLPEPQSKAPVERDGMNADPKFASPCLKGAQLTTQQHEMRFDQRTSRTNRFDGFEETNLRATGSKRTQEMNNNSASPRYYIFRVVKPIPTQSELS
jgi:hypothetical protein